MKTSAQKAMLPPVPMGGKMPMKPMMAKAPAKPTKKKSKGKKKFNFLAMIGKKKKKK